VPATPHYQLVRLVDDRQFLGNLFAHDVSSSIRTAFSKPNFSRPCGVFFSRSAARNADNKQQCSLARDLALRASTTPRPEYYFGLSKAKHDKKSKKLKKLRTY
jgi:hypothetical protein